MGEQADGPTGEQANRRKAFCTGAIHCVSETVKPLKRYAWNICLDTA